MTNKGFKLLIFISVFLAIELSSIGFAETHYNKAEDREALTGGSGTVFVENKNAYSLPLKNLKIENRINFFVGNSMFRRVWLPPSDVHFARDGLGPFFNADSCQGCHINDGRGHLPSSNWPNDDAVSLVIALAIPPQNDMQKNQLETFQLKSIPDPIYGSQLSDFAIDGVLPEGKIDIEYDYYPVAFDNGKVINLSKPKFSISNLNYGELHSDIQISARIAQPIIGLGLIEGISVSDILANADPNDKNKDGISGKASTVKDEISNSIILGRFGWKAAQPSILQQTIDATYHDMGLSNTYSSRSNNCSEVQVACKSMVTGNSTEYDGVEVSNEQIDLMVFYQKHLSPPGRRNVDDPEVLKGKKIFFESGCGSCHVQKYTTSIDEKNPSLSEQLIWPYSDFLLHDMGKDLADNLNEYNAMGNEWRTPPLWGIGLTRTVNGHENFLHDGRARNILEAILWHGGEAEESKKKILKLSLVGVEYLLKFIESL